MYSHNTKKVNSTKKAIIVFFLPRESSLDEFFSEKRPKFDQILENFYSKGYSCMFVIFTRFAPVKHGIS